MSKSVLLIFAIVVLTSSSAPRLFAQDVENIADKPPVQRAARPPRLKRDISGESEDASQDVTAKPAENQAQADENLDVEERLRRLRAEFEEFKRRQDRRDARDGRGQARDEDFTDDSPAEPRNLDDRQFWSPTPVGPVERWSLLPADPTFEVDDELGSDLPRLVNYQNQPSSTLPGFPKNSEPAGPGNQQPPYNSANQPSSTLPGFPKDEDQHQYRRTDQLGSIGFPETRPYKPNMPPKMRKVEAEFGDGLTVKSDDGYFSLTFHNLTQVDLRTFSPTGDPLNDSFLIPRQRWYVLGNVSPYVKYYTVINRGYGTIDLLDAWTDFRIGEIEEDKLQIRVGRMKTPYTYEYIKISENDLIAPERSVYVGNLAPNREVGAMAHGQVFNKQLEYALGVFNGPRRSFQDFNNSKDIFTFLNTKPFLAGDSDVLREVNVGGSFNFGNEHNPASPFALRTANDQSTSAGVGNVSPTFFQYLSNVYEQGQRMQWSGDLAYYYKSFSMLAGYQGGFQDYALSTGSLSGTSIGVVGGKPTRVDSSGYSVAFTYFLTGEEITRRRELLEPRNEYNPAQRKYGAVEAFTRFANLTLGGNVFTAGLADPNVSSNRANVVDTGVNWYLNHYVKLTFDWQYAGYGGPVELTPTTTTNHNNLFWFRTQVFF